MEPLLGIVIAVLLLERFMDRRDRRQETTAWRLERTATGERHADQTNSLVNAVREAQESRRGEIANLLQRIQAPEQAVIDHAVHQHEPSEPVLPMTDEEYAERQAAIEAIEHMEREGVMP